MILLFAPLKGIQHDIPPAIGTPTTQLAAICISHAFELHFWQRMRSCDFDRGTTITTFLHYMNAFNLLTVLENHPEVHPLFAASCRFFFNISAYWPATNAMLKGIRAFVEQTGTRLPQDCQLYMVDATMSHVSGDLPISWVRTNDVGIVELVGDDSQDSQHVGLELGRLITRWSATSLAD